MPTRSRFCAPLRKAVPRHGVTGAGEATKRLVHICNRSRGKATQTGAPPPWERRTGVRARGAQDSRPSLNCAGVVQSLDEPDVAKHPAYCNSTHYPRDRKRGQRLRPHVMPKARAHRYLYRAQREGSTIRGPMHLDPVGVFERGLGSIQPHRRDADEAVNDWPDGESWSQRSSRRVLLNALRGVGTGARRPRASYIRQVDLPGLSPQEGIRPPFGAAGASSCLLGVTSAVAVRSDLRRASCSRRFVELIEEECQLQTRRHWSKRPTNHILGVTHALRHRVPLDA